MVPVFTSDMNQHVISEGTQPGTVVYTLRATSGDEKADGSLQFFIRDSDSFAVNATTGEVVLLQPLDREVFPLSPALLSAIRTVVDYKKKESVIIPKEPSKIPHPASIYPSLRHQIERHRFQPTSVVIEALILEICTDFNEYLSLKREQKKKLSFSWLLFHCLPCDVFKWNSRR